jgi:hypothetical protein
MHPKLVCILPFIPDGLRGLRTYSPCRPAVVAYITLYACFGSHSKWLLHTFSLYIPFMSRPQNRSYLYGSTLQYDCGDANICRCIWFIVITPFHAIYWSHLGAPGFYAFQYVFCSPIHVHTSPIDVNGLQDPEVDRLMGDSWSCDMPSGCANRWVSCGAYIT